MKKLIIAFVIILALPVVFHTLKAIIPQSITIERFEAALNQSGLVPEGVQRCEQPNLDAAEEFSLRINGDHVQLFRYADRGKIAAQYEYQKKDAGSAIVETWQLSESLGAAKPSSKPSSAARSGMFMVVVTSEDAALRQKVIEVFKSL